MKKALLAILMTIAMAGLSHAGQITQEGAYDHLYDNLFYVQFSNHGRGPVENQVCPLTPGDRAIEVDRHHDKIKLIITSGSHKDCEGWTWRRNYKE